MKRILIVLLALSLSGCAQFQSFEANVASGIQAVKATVGKALTPDNFDSITLAYYAIEAAGNAYRDTCERKLIAKTCWTIIRQLQPYENKAYNSYLVLKDFVKSNPTLDASHYIQLARDAIDVLKSKQNENGVK